MTDINKRREKILQSSSQLQPERKIQKVDLNNPASLQQQAYSQLTGDNSLDFTKQLQQSLPGVNDQNHLAQAIGVDPALAGVAQQIFSGPVFPSAVQDNLNQPKPNCTQQIAELISYGVTVHEEPDNIMIFDDPNNMLLDGDVFDKTDEGLVYNRTEKDTGDFVRRRRDATKVTPEQSEKLQQMIKDAMQQPDPEPEPEPEFQWELMKPQQPGISGSNIHFGTNPLSSETFPDWFGDTFTIYDTLLITKKKKIFTPKKVTEKIPQSVLDLMKEEEDE